MPGTTPAEPVGGAVIDVLFGFVCEQRFQSFQRLHPSPPWPSRRLQCSKALAMCFSTMLREIPMRSATSTWDRPSNLCRTNASRRRGGSSASAAARWLRRCCCFETLPRPGRLAFQRGGFVVRRRPVEILAAALLPAPMVAQQVAGDLEKKCARLLDDCRPGHFSHWAKVSWARSAASPNCPGACAGSAATRHGTPDRHARRNHGSAHPSVHPPAAPPAPLTRCNTSPPRFRRIRKSLANMRMIIHIISQGKEVRRTRAQPARKIR